MSVFFVEFSSLQYMYIYLSFAIKVCENVYFHTFFQSIFKKNFDTYCMTSTWSMAHWSYPVFRCTGCHHRNWTPSFLASSGRSYAALFGRRYSSASWRARSFHSAPYIWKKNPTCNLLREAFLPCWYKWQLLFLRSSLCADQNNSTCLKWILSV